MGWGASTSSRIAFQVPEGLDGCYVPVVATMGAAVSNFTAVSVSASGGPCSDAPARCPRHLGPRRADGIFRLTAQYPSAASWRQPPRAGTVAIDSRAPVSPLRSSSPAGREAAVSAAPPAV